MATPSISPIGTTDPISSVPSNQTPGSQPASTPTPSAPADSASDLRLVIEQSTKEGAYVYKTVDRRTGEVLKQIPREDVLKTKDDANYGPGTVYNGLI